MYFDESVLKSDEKVSLTLRSLYAKNGYTRFKMSKFEEYDLYSRNKDFLVSDGVITFTDTNGKLLALKPDVTLSIVKNSKDIKGQIQKVYYNENVYRISETSRTYKELMQTGLECIGDLDDKNIAEVLRLACESLNVISENWSLNLSNAALLSEILKEIGVEDIKKREAMKAIRQKNTDELNRILAGNETLAKYLTASFASPKEAFEKISKIAVKESSKKELINLTELYNSVSNSEFRQKIKFDFSIVEDDGYYSGAVFKGYIDGIESPVLSGGRYDRLMKKMGKNSSAIGFAVYLDFLERFEDKNASRKDSFISVALPKGRLGEKVYGMFEAAGFDCSSIREENRKLIFENKEKAVRFFWVKPSDVAIYVERGAADIGVAGKDILEEYKPEVYELLDLGVGQCRMAVAAKKGFKDDPAKTLRVATKFSNIAHSWYAEQCRDIDIIHLNGSIELAPILNLSDVIVDIVETGKTLLENDLEPIETILPISARLIANKSAFQFKKDKIETIKNGLNEQTQARNKI